MEIKIVRIEPTNQVSSTGKKKYYAYSGEGDRHIAWGDWVEDSKGKDVDVTVKKESYKGNDYTVIWPTKEPVETASIPSEVSTRPVKPRASAENTTSSTRYLSSIDKRDRMMAKESALKSATQVWSTKVTAGLDGDGKEDPLEMAKRFYEWILREPH